MDEWTPLPSTYTLGSIFLMDGWCITLPDVVYCHPWYGHCSCPSINLPRWKGH